jgi:hypothetical protein
MKDQKALQSIAIARQRRQTCAMAMHVGRRCGAVGCSISETTTLDDEQKAS